MFTPTENFPNLYPHGALDQANMVHGAEVRRMNIINYYDYAPLILTNRMTAFVPWD